LAAGFLTATFLAPLFTMAEALVFVAGFFALVVLGADFFAAIMWLP
jgi:hypothetical protein